MHQKTGQYARDTTSFHPFLTKWASSGPRMQNPIRCNRRNLSQPYLECIPLSAQSSPGSVRCSEAIFHFLLPGNALHPVSLSAMQSPAGIFSVRQGQKCTLFITAFYTYSLSASPCGRAVSVWITITHFPGTCQWFSKGTLPYPSLKTCFL